MGRIAPQMTHFMKSALCVAPLALFGSDIAVAQAEGVAAGLTACRALPAAEARLACYDAIPVEPAGQADRAQRFEAERDTFGFDRARIADRMQSQRARGVSVSMIVERVSERGDGSLMFVMTNGQRWVQDESAGLRNVRPGDEVLIRRAALGSYMLISPRGGATHRVRRLS